MTYRAIIFDLDGTLVDTLTDLGNAMNMALADFALTGHSIESYRQMIGNGLSKLAQRALPNKKQHCENEVLAAMKQYYRRNYLKNTYLYDGIKQILSKLQDKDIRLAVLTNKDQDMAEKIIMHFFGDSLFEYIVGTTGSGPVKPDSNATKELMGSMSLKPEDFLFVGDSGVDMDTAAAAGIRSVGVAWGFRGKAELAEHNADIIIENPEQLLALLT